MVLLIKSKDITNEDRKKRDFCIGIEAAFFSQKKLRGYTMGGIAEWAINQVDMWHNTKDLDMLYGSYFNDWAE